MRGKVASNQHKSSNAQANNSHHDISKPQPIKLNGLKNRIIQRPPPLILDKVSNFYDNDTPGQQVQAHSQTTNSNNNNVGLESNHTHENQPIPKSNSNRLLTTNQIGENVNNQTNNHRANSANHKFWASLNENASRTKALATARTEAISETSNTSNDLAKDSTTDIIGADLIITKRHGGGLISTSRVVPNFSNRKASSQRDQYENVNQFASLEHTSNEQQTIRDATHQSKQNSDSNDEEHKRNDAFNGSTGPYDDVIVAENGGGNLIGVDNTTPPVTEQQHHNDELPASATSSRPRSNNPFLEPDDNFTTDLSLQKNHFSKRPASFIAATDKVTGVKQATNRNNSIAQDIVEEQLNDLQLSNTPSQRQVIAHATENHSYSSGSILINQQRIDPLDQRDSRSDYPPNIMTNQQVVSQSSQHNQVVQQPTYGAYGDYATSYRQGAISLDSESTICQPPPSATMQLPHWIDAIYELNNAILETSSIGGGAENGQFIYIVESGDIILELDQIKVSGFSLVEFNELAESRQFHLLKAVQTKHSYGLTNDIKCYLNMSFPKNSEDKQLQNIIRDNIYRRTIPCTTRPPKQGEVDKVDYYFLTKEQFLEMDNRGMLLECGVYAGHCYGTMKPFCDLDGISIHQPTTQRDKFDILRQTWDANHPAVDMTIKKQTSFTSDNHLYENHESLKMQQQLSQPILRPSSIHYANQNGMPLAGLETTEPDMKLSRIVAVDSEALPPGWERVIDQTHGTYYIDHNTQRTQYERPYEIELTKGAMGFGFTLVEADNGLLLVRSIIPGGPAHLNGHIRPGDILVSAVGVSVAGLQHTDIARLFSTFAVGDRTRLTFARSSYVLDENLVPDEYLFSNGTNGDLAIAVNSNSYYNNLNNQSITLVQNPHQIIVDHEYELITVTLKRGDQGFGFTIIDAIAGQRVKKIQNTEVCSNLKQGDIIISLNCEDVTKLSHKEVVERLKNCPSGKDVVMVVKRKKRFRSKTPMAMHTDATDMHSLDSTPQRNCKTPNLDGLMLRRPANYDPGVPLVAKALFQDHPVSSQLDPSHNFIPHSVSSLPPQITLEHSQFGQHMYGTLRPKLHQIVPQPVYGVNQQRMSHQDPYYEQTPSLPPLPVTSNLSDIDLKMHAPNRPASSIPSLDGQGRDNLTNSVHASETSLPPVKFKPNINELRQVNQYNNFMNNDKLMMMQLHQQKTCQMAVPASSMQHQQSSDYYQMPLYSNSEVMQNEVNQPVTIPTPTKPAVNLYAPNTYSANNYYANNEEIALQQVVQYGSLPTTVVNGQFGPMTDQFAYMHSASQHGAPTPHEEHDEYEYHHVELDRENTDSNWGIRLIGGAEVDRAISVGSIVFGGAASKNGKLKSGDEIISINGVNVVGATHQHVVELISACTNRASLVVQRKKFAEACEVILTRNMDEGFGFVIISSGNCALIGRIIEGSPADRCQQLHVRDRIIAVNGRYISPSMQHPDIVNMIKECGSTLRLRIIPVDCYTVELIKSAQSDNFGFSMRGGSEYDGTPLYILRVAPNGLARDLLNVGDQIIEINNIPTVGMTHQQAATIIKFSDPIVKLKLRRNLVTPPSLLVDSPRALAKFNQVTAEMQTNNLDGSQSHFTSCDGGSIASDMCASSKSGALGLGPGHPSMLLNHQGVGIANNQAASLATYGQTSLPLYAT